MMMRRRSQSYTAMLDLTCFLLVWASYAFSQSAASDDQPLWAESAVWRATLAEMQEMPDTLERRLVFSVADKRTGELKDLSYQGILASVSGLALIERKLVTTGTVGGTAGGFFAVVDLESGRQDTIWTHKYQFSPSRRFLVFSSWYARGVPPATRRSIVLMYDMAKSAAENRLDSYRERRHQVYSGKPVFPEENVKQRSYNRLLAERHYIMSPFLWSADETRIVFIAFAELERRNYLVKIDLSKGLDEPVVRRKDLDVKEYIKWDIIRQSTIEELEAKPYGLVTKALSWNGAERVVVRPYPQYWLPKELTLILPASE